MKIRRSIILICAGAIALISLLVWSVKQSNQSITQSRKAAEQPTVGQAATNIADFQHRISPNSDVAPATNTRSTNPETKFEQAQRGLSELNDEQIVFYGKVVDQFGQPVAGANVAASIRVNNGTRVGVDRLSFTTDANGSFAVSGYKGKDLGLWVVKAGYVMATSKTSFVYSLLWSETERHKPDPNIPTIIKMWKLQGAEPLVAINQRYKFPYTGTPLNVDLLAGKIVPSGGDIKITVIRSQGVVSERTLSDWSVQLEVVDGGLIRTEFNEARVTYAAPENGYESRDSFMMSTNPPNKWFGGIHQIYYLKSRDGQMYGKINLGIGINQNPEDKISLEFSGIANTNGSRNWEADAPNSK